MGPSLIKLFIFEPNHVRMVKKWYSYQITWNYFDLKMGFH